MKEKDDFVFIEHILDSINAIENFSIDLTLEELTSNRMKRNAIVREIEIIGEAAKNLSDNFKNKNKEIPWKEIIGTRDKAIHHYFDIDLGIVLGIIQNDIPDLKNKLLKIKKSGFGLFKGIPSFKKEDKLNSHFD